MRYLDLLIEPGFLLEFLVICFIIYKQIKSYNENKKRMWDYMSIFSHPDTWDVERDDMERVSSIIGGAANPFFRDIKETINKYIAGNSNSVMDFQIFKDTVDRQCDSIENQIESQTPVPLYLGLAGSMIGIIIGLITLVVDGSFSQLLSGDKESLLGIGSLLLAVAIAMIASLCGIVLTVFTTSKYKESRSKAENLKNEFISWMQSTLFPALPNDISMAMTQLVSDLENFNDQFEKNTSSLAHTFDNVNEAYRTQADIVSAVQKMDVQSMATANVKVLDALNRSTEKIERFNEYLDSIHGYTDTIQKFNEQFHEDENQLGLLRQIRDFFKTELNEIEQRKQAIADAVSNVDFNLRNSFKQLSVDNEHLVEQFKMQLEDQASKYNELLDMQKETFTKAYDQMQQELEEKLRNFPEVFTKLENISDIPEELHTLTANMQHSNEQLTSQLVQAMSQMSSNFIQAISHIQPHKDGKGTETPSIVKPALSKKVLVLGLSMIGFTMIAVITLTVFVIIQFFK